MKRSVLPLVAVSIVLAGLFFLLRHFKQEDRSGEKTVRIDPVFNEPLDRMKRCETYPRFLRKQGIVPPVVIDLSQKRFKGVAFLYGSGFKKVYNPIAWQRFEHMGTYALDEKGNLYLTPTPYISIKPSTFNLQKRLYLVDTESGKLESFIRFEDVIPDNKNPYGIVSIAYDCEAKRLWVGSIDQSGYQDQKGKIYQIDPKTKKVSQKVTGIDALSLAIVKGKEGTYLAVGNAMYPRVELYPIVEGRLKKTHYVWVELPDPTLRVRKIKKLKNGRWQLEAIPFHYTLVAESSQNGLSRIRYELFFDPKKKKWEFF